MREELKKKLGSRLRFKGTFKKYGLKNAYKGLRLETVCLQDVKTMQGEEVTDHLWFNHTKGFRALGLLYPGDIIAFDARVESYLKRGPREEYEEYYKVVDYHLTRPTKLKVLAKGAPRNIYNVCEKCGHPNGLSKKWCRRCGAPLEEQEQQPEKPEAPKFIEPELRQATFEEEFTSIMKSIGVKTK